MELLRYFYHPDHASTRLNNLWITDGTGQAIQHLHYLPFGEDWVDQRNSTWNAPYTFSGKEKDVETGYGYFGARYYDSGLSIWLSVDPMSDKYPSMSPYNYCANNPVILVDPDGREFTDPDPPTTYTIKKGDTFWGIENKYNLPHGTLKSANSFLNPKKLKPGTVINLTTFGDELNIVPNDVPTGPLPDYYTQPTSTGPTINMDNYKTLAPFLTLWNVAGMFVGNGSQYEFNGPPEKTFPSYGPVPYPGKDPTKAPKGYEWKGQPGSVQGSKQGSYVNPNTKEVLRPDLNHAPPIKPHWDYTNSSGTGFRLFPNGALSPK
jgi:RHS repeat-associated protein